MTKQEQLQELIQEEVMLTKVYLDNKNLVNWNKLIEVRTKGRELEDEINIDKAVTAPIDIRKFWLN